MYFFNLLMYFFFLKECVSCFYFLLCQNRERNNNIYVTL